MINLRQLEELKKMIESGNLCLESLNNYLLHGKPLIYLLKTSNLDSDILKAKTELAVKRYSWIKVTTEGKRGEIKTLVKIYFI